MSASVEIYRFIGNVGTPAVNNGIVDITNGSTRANAYDPPANAGATGLGTLANDTNFPIQIPTSGSNYSYWVSTRLNVSSGPNGTLNNIRWYAPNSAPAGWSGINLWVGQANAYVQAIGTQGTSGTPMVQGMSGTSVNYTSSAGGLVALPAPGSGWSPVTLYGGGNVFVTNGFNYTATTPMLIFSPSPPAQSQAAYVNPTSATSPPYQANLVVYQFEITSNATAGVATAAQFVWKYDET